MNHTFLMFLSMILAGLLSNMNVFADKFDDIRLSLNDVYMTLFMTGWMFIFMGIFTQNKNWIFLGFLLVVFNLYAIRTQLFISQTQYLLGMIPHHSMAILMSKKLMEKTNSIETLLSDIITSQTNEIILMKKQLDYK